MKHVQFFTLLLLVSGSLSAQTAIQQAINTQVWKPFIEAYNALDAEAFMAVHTQDVVRVIRDSEEIKQGATYAQDMMATSDRQRRRNLTRTIELRFSERFADGDFAFEAGYYKVVNTYSESEQYTFYGRFNVFLRKENGQWKIFLDSDTNDDGKIGEADFLKGKAME